MSLLKDSTCKITVSTNSGANLERGTGFFISKKKILTCKHVVENQDGNITIEKCRNQNGELTAKVIDTCELTDYALLELIEDFESECFLELCDSELIEDEKILGFGFPNDEQGLITGEPFNGTIDSVFSEHKLAQDISLRIENFAHDSKYEAFSGSAVINENQQVIAVLNYKAVRSLSAVSIKKAKIFLEKNSVSLKPDQLQSFDHYKNNVFHLLPEDIKNDCEAHSGIVIQNVHPSKILEDLVDDIFYPKKNKNISEIIKELKLNKDLNNSIWRGWIKLLTYVNMIRGDYSDINHIKFNLNDIDVKELYGDVKKMEGNVSIPVRISFYFTEDKSFFQIARTYIQMENKVEYNSCSIFNSKEEHFSIKKFTNADKARIILNISGDSNTAFKIEERIHIGVLSLNALTEEIANSSDLNDINVNIKKLFLDAIK